MSRPSVRNASAQRLHALAMSLTVVGLCSSAELALAAKLPTFGDSQTHTAIAGGRQPSASQTWIVQNCSDAAANSLRDILENPTKAKSGDTVDLSQLPMLCAATHSTITLSSGEITAAQDDIELVGPDAEIGTVTISGGHASRVLRHIGAGTLSIANLAIADGYYHTAGDAFGGCILQPPTGGGLYLQNVSVSGCVVSSDTATAHGGGIDAAGPVFLVTSTISGNTAKAPQGKAFGGGLEATQAATLYASITANSSVGLDSTAGGAYVRTVATLFGTVIDHNAAATAGGLLLGRVQGATAMIVNSTISNNVSESSSAALYAATDSFKLWNSTIAFNRTTQPSSDAAVMLNGLPSAMFDLTSSIVANNFSGPTNDEADLYFVTGSGTITGSHDLIMASNVSPPNMIVSTDDPKLGQLQNNGGLTRSHMPASDSPALAMGIDDGLVYEQRGPGYPRSVGNTTDIGAVQFDSIFKGNFD